MAASPSLAVHTSSAPSPVSRVPAVPPPRLLPCLSQKNPLGSRRLHLLSSPLASPSPAVSSPNSGRRRFLRFSSGEEEEVELDDGYGEDGDDCEDDEEGGGIDELSPVDFETMEEEASDVVREFSHSLSRELVIDEDLRFKKDVGGKQKSIKSSRLHVPDQLLPRVTIVGRPNVGKSALFNRLVGGNRAIVVDEPGVTRDRLYGRSFWGEYEFMVVDTGGVMTLAKSQVDVMEELAITATFGMDGIPLASREAAIARMPSMIERQAIAAVEEAAVIIFLVDGQAGLVTADVEIADWLRKHYSKKPIILAVNKCESPRKGLLQASEFWSLGFSPLPISAVSGTGTGELLDLVCAELKSVENFNIFDEKEDYIPSIAIVGRPNVGKSSILNALVGEDRTIVSPISGTTRDAIDMDFMGPDGQKYRLIDTAGIRRRAAVASAGSTTEGLSVNRAFRAIRRSDVVALVIEAMVCITEQDCRIAERIEREGKGCVIVVNKWDTIPNKNQQTTTYYGLDVREKLRTLDWAPIVYSTATSGQSIDGCQCRKPLSRQRIIVLVERADTGHGLFASSKKLFRDNAIITAAGTVERERSRRLSTAILNQVVQEALAFKPPPRTRGGRRGRIYYCTQAAIRPPTFVFFVNDSKLFPETYRRYMEKQLRSDAGFSGTPIRLLWRSRRKLNKEDKAAPSNSQASAARTAGKLVVTT